MRNKYCGVTGSRSSRKEKNRSEEEQEELEENKVRTLKISGLLLVGFGKVSKLRNLGKLGDPRTSFRRTHAIKGQSRQGIGWSS